MSEKTEQPTPKKLRDAKKKGDVAMSRDANNVLTYLLGISLIFATAGGIASTFRVLYLDAIHLIRLEAFGPDVLIEAVMKSLRVTFRRLAPVIFPIAALGILISFAQVGVVMSAESMKPKLDKLNPLNQLKSWFSVKGLFEFAKTLLKLFFVFLLGYLSIEGSLGMLLQLGYAPGEAILPLGAGVAKDFLFTVGMVFTLLGALDFAFQRWQWKKKLMMSKDEVKREYKEQEGDPEVKAERKQIHQEIVNQDVERAVASADAIVVNPTHFAVAIEYKKGKTAAPKVVAKGRELLAGRIRKLGKKYDVPTVRDITLARALFEVELDHYVPEDLYEAVAEILMFAWRVRREAGGDAFSRGA